PRARLSGRPSVPAPRLRLPGDGAERRAGRPLGAPRWHVPARRRRDRGGRRRRGRRCVRPAVRGVRRLDGQRADPAAAGSARAVEAILAELRGILAEPVKAEELADAQSYLTGVLPLALESNDGVARTLLSIELYDLGLDYLERYPEIIRALTREQLLAAGRAHLSAENYALAVVRPQAKA